MMTMTEQTSREVASSIRIELVDNWHKDWERVYAFVDRLGQRDALRVDSDGWLSARQNLLVAFVGDEPAAHACFRVEPMTTGGRAMLQDGRLILQARMDAFAVESQGGVNRPGMEQLLRTSAALRARELNCRQLIGFDRE